MGIDDNIRLNAAFAEGHVDCWPLLGTNTLLTMPRGELITDDGRASYPDTDMELKES
jgi:hypothetical protein